MKTAVITGATRGIGRAITEKFATQGFAVAICGRNKNELEKFALYLKEQYKTDVVALATDVADKSQLQNFADAIKNHFAQTDVLVNNAGTFLPGAVSEEEEGTFEKLMAVNLAAPYHFTRMMLPLLLKTPYSHIFNMCSIASIQAYINGGSYCISKYGLLGMTKVLREELKTKNVKVTAVLPGATYTDSWTGSGLPQERFIPVNEIAEAVWAAYNTSPSTVIEEVIIRPQLGDI